MGVLTADIVARAIVAACSETGGNPELVAMGVTRETQGNDTVAHARSYAALALIKVLPDLNRAVAARAVGAKCSNYIRQLEHRMRNQALGWFDGESLQRVVASTRAEARLALVSNEDRQPLVTRRRASPTFEVVTSGVMGDPPPRRSALDQKRAQR